jgi:hypothetical protein
LRAESEYLQHGIRAFTVLLDCGRNAQMPPPPWFLDGGAVLRA